MARPRFSLVLALGVWFSTRLFAHAILGTSYTDPVTGKVIQSAVSSRVPGEGSVGSGKNIKIAPCAGMARTNTPTPLTAGSKITIVGLEFIHHPSNMQVFLYDQNDNLIRELGEISHTTTHAGNFNFNVQVTVPSDVPCNPCTLGFKQQMNENPVAPTYYYDCADIVIAGAPSSTPPASPPTGPAPASLPTNDQCSAPH